MIRTLGVRRLGKTMENKGKTLATGWMTFVTKGKAFVTKQKTLVTKGKTMVTKGKNKHIETILVRSVFFGRNKSQKVANVSCWQAVSKQLANSYQEVSNQSANC